MAERQVNRDFWEVRGGNDVICCSTVPFLGYPLRVLQDMYASGLCLYRNGNRVKKCELMLA